MRNTWGNRWLDSIWQRDKDGVVDLINAMDKKHGTEKTKEFLDYLADRFGKYQEYRKSKRK